MASPARTARSARSIEVWAPRWAGHSSGRTTTSSFSTNRPATWRTAYDDTSRRDDVRSRKYRIVTAVERLNNRLTRFALRKGIAPGAFALLETTGRRTGLPRLTPVGNGCVGDTFWLVAAHGTHAAYVRNLQIHPAVREK